MTDAFYERIGDERFRATEATRGPWSRDHQHAGPPAALLGGALADALGDGLVTRLTFEILRPVAITDLTVTTSLVRPGRRVALAEGQLADDEGPVLLARAWRMQAAQDEVTPHEESSLPPPHDCPPSRFFDVDWDGYHTALELRAARGDFLEPGDAAVWTRSRIDVRDDRPITALDRVLLVADSGNGISAWSPPDELLYINTDLNVHLRDVAAGPWVGLDAQTRFGPHGTGVATSQIHDERGVIGIATQGLFVRQR